MLSNKMERIMTCGKQRIGVHWLLMAGMMLIAIPVGCGRGSSLPLAATTGHVTFKGKPIAGCRVTFTPVGSLASGGGRTATAMTAADGGFELFTDGKPGAAVGEYAVYVGSEDANNPLPGTAAENLRFTVAAEANDCPIELSATERTPRS